MWSSVPRALSRQTAPAVAAGAASRTSVSSIVATVTYKTSPYSAICWIETRWSGRSVRTAFSQTTDHPD